MTSPTQAAADTQHVALLSFINVVEAQQSSCSQLNLIMTVSTCQWNRLRSAVSCSMSLNVFFERVLTPLNLSLNIFLQLSFKKGETYN